MTKLLDRLRAGVIERDPAPLQNLIFSWAAERGKSERLPFAQERLMESINENPCSNRKERTDSLGWSIKKFQAAKDRLEQEGFIETQEIARGVGRPDTFLVLTDKGFRYLRNHRVKEKRLHGSLEHHCAIQKLKAHFESKRYVTKLNQKMSPKLIVDLICEGDDERGAVEVVSSNNLKRDAKKCGALAKRCSWVRLVATSRDLFDYYVSRLGKELSQPVLEKVQVSFLDELLSTEN